MDPKDLIFRGLIPGMDVVGEKFRRNEYYVPQVLLSARAMYAGLDLLKPLITKAGGDSQSLGVIVIGTAQGDLHDIGKNLVAMPPEIPWHAPRQRPSTATSTGSTLPNIRNISVKQ